jgi:predicted ATPase
MPHKTLVGREDEITYLKKLLDDAILGKGRIVFISGEAGIGKTRLVEELVSYAQDMGVLFIQGRCLYREGADPYLPFLDALRDHSARMARQAQDDRELPLSVATGIGAEPKETAPMGVSVMGDGSAAGSPEDWEEEKAINITEELRRIDIGRERDRMYETVSSMILGIARTRPLLFFLDDIHWADNATLQLLGYVVRNIRTSRVLMVAAYRPEELVMLGGQPHPLLAAMERIGREGISSTLTLKRVGIRETRHLLSIFLNRTDFPQGFVETVYRQTEGNPFFIEEVIKSLMEQGIIDPADARWHEKVDMTSITIPSSVRAVITQRVARLDQPAIRTLENASVIGQEFTFEVLKGISELSEEELVEALERLMTARLVYEDPGGDSYHFTHTMIREVVYESLSRTRKRMMHRKVAASIESVHGHHPDQVIYALAYHVSNAGDLPKSAKYFSEAGHKALKSYALDEAARYYTSALEALEKLEPGPENLNLEVEVLVSLGNVHYTAGEWDAALGEFREAIKLGEEAGCEGPCALSHLRMGEIGEKRSDWALASESFGKALEIYHTIKDLSGQANVHQAMVMMYWRKGEYQKALEAGGVGLLLLKKAGDKYLTAMTDIALGNVHYDMGDFVRSRQYYEDGLKLAQEAGDQLETARAFHRLGNIEMRNGRLDAALNLFEKSVEAAKKSGNIRQVGYALTSSGECLARMGDLEKAMEYLDRSITIFEKLEEKVMIGSIMMLRGIIYRNIEDWETARKCFTESTRVVEELNIPYTLGEHLLEFGITCAMEGDRKEARRLLTRALHTFEPIGAKKYIEKTRAELRRLEESEKEPA